MHNYNTA